jgi:type IV pilus assembly protein PilW
LATADFTFKFVPVLIIRTANAPDELRTLFGNSAFVSVNRKFTGGTNTTKSLVFRDAFQLGDKVIFTDSATDDSGVCAMAEISGYVSNLIVSHAQGETYTSFYTGASVVATMNAAGSANTQVAAAGVSGNFAYDLGPEPTLTSWRVSSAGAANPGKLLRRNILISDTDTEVAEGVADLKAQYGVDANGDGAISSSEWQDADPTDWTRLLAVRFAVLARSQQFEKTEVTTTAPSWSAGAFTMRNADGTTDAHDGSVNDWRHYRYRVYESVVPLRNMLWHP